MSHIIERLDHIIKKIEDLEYKVEAFIAKAEAFQPDLKYSSETRSMVLPKTEEPLSPRRQENDVITSTDSKLEVSEEIIMDLTNITIMAMTEKAVLAVKGGYQKWVPLSCIDNMQNEIGYELGSQYDLMLLPKKEWISKKAGGK